MPDDPRDDSDIRDLVASLGADPAPEFAAGLRTRLAIAWQDADEAVMSEPASRRPTRRPFLLLAAAIGIGAAVVAAVALWSGDGDSALDVDTPPATQPDTPDGTPPSTGECTEPIALPGPATEPDPRPEADGVVAVTGLPGTIGTGGSGAGGIWVAGTDHDEPVCLNSTARAVLARIDPTTATVAETVEVAGADAFGPGGGRLESTIAGPWFPTFPASGNPDAVAVGDDALWVVAGGSPEWYLLRVDLDTHDATRVDGVPCCVDRLAYGEGALFGVETGSSGTNVVVRVDPRTLDVTTAELPGQARAVAAGEGAVWVTIGGPGRDGHALLRFDPVTLEETARLTFADPGYELQPHELVAGDGQVWVVGGTAGGSERGYELLLHRLDPATAEILDTIQLPGTNGCCDSPALVLGDGMLLVRSESNSARVERLLHRVDTDSGEVTGVATDLTEVLGLGTFVQPASIADGALWAGGPYWVVRIDLDAVRNGNWRAAP